MAGPDGDGASRGGPRAYPGGARPARGGEVERVVTDEHRRALQVQSDPPRDVRAGGAIAVDRAERQPGGVHAVAVNLGVIDGQRQHVAADGSAASEREATLTDPR